MKTYLFITTTTVKPIDKGRWWIDDKLVSNMYIQADNLHEALKEYQKRIEDHGVTISNNALKNKSPMFRDDKDGNLIQVGYVITGKTLFNDEKRWIDKYIDLWVEIQEISNPFIKEEVEIQEISNLFIKEEKVL